MEKFVIFMLNIVHQLSTLMVVNIMSICVTLVVGMGLNVVTEVFILLVIVIVVISTIVRLTFVDVTMLSFFVMVRVMSFLMVICVAMEILSLSAVFSYFEIRGTMVNNFMDRLVMIWLSNFVVMLIADIHLLKMVRSDLSMGFEMFGWGLLCVVLTVVMSLHGLFIVSVVATVPVMVILVIVMCGHLEVCVKRSDIDLFAIVMSVLVVMSFLFVIAMVKVAKRVMLSLVMNRHAFLIELKQLLVGRKNWQCFYVVLI